DTTNFTPDMNASSADEPSVDAVQLAQATPAGAPVQVVIPAGANVVRVPVTAGETIELPFGADAHLLGKLGDNGNLAIKVGDVTVILEGYTAAEGQQPVIIETADGGAEGAQGADNTGAIFEAFGPGNGIGGFGAVGALNGTALDYTLIDADQKLFIQQPAPSTVPTFTGGEPNGDVVDFLFNEDDLKPRQIDIDAKAIASTSSDFDGNDEFDGRDNDDILPGNIPDDHREPVTATAVVNIDF